MDDEIRDLLLSVPADASEDDVRHILRRAFGRYVTNRAPNLAVSRERREMLASIGRALREDPEPAAATEEDTRDGA